MNSNIIIQLLIQYFLIDKNIKIVQIFGCQNKSGRIFESNQQQLSHN